MESQENTSRQSPAYLQMSLAAAMTLGFKPGLFYRNARLYCVNLLLSYDRGCIARCAYCGLSGGSHRTLKGQRFIRVQWPTYHLDAIVEGLIKNQGKVKRVCISMITHKRAVGDTNHVCDRLRSSVDIPVSLLVSPTVMHRGDLEAFKTSGADKIGVAIDLATPALFDQYRGAGAKGPHTWPNYWRCLEKAIDVFGTGNAGAHLMVGMGETEQQMCATIQRIRDMGGQTHLFSFFPEVDSVMAMHPKPPLSHYRRIQLARHIIDHQIGHAGQFVFNNQGRIIDFGFSPVQFDELVDSGNPFRTSGCVGYDGQVACNRPFANSRPGKHLRNYPFAPTAEDIALIKRQLGMGSPGHGIRNQPPDS